MGAKDCFVCLFVCLSACISLNHSLNFTQFSELWPWLGPPLTAVTTTLFTSGFADDVMPSYNWSSSRNQRRCVSFIQFAGWRHRGRSLPSPTASCFWCCHRGSSKWWLHTERRQHSDKANRLWVSRWLLPATVRIHDRHLLLLLILQKADTHFTVPLRVEGWIDLDSAVKVCNMCPKLYIAMTVVINTTYCRGEIRTCRDPHTAVIMLPLDHCDMQLANYCLQLFIARCLSCSLRVVVVYVSRQFVCVSAVLLGSHGQILIDTCKE